MTKLNTVYTEVPTGTTAFGIGGLFSGAAQGTTLQSGVEPEDTCGFLGIDCWACSCSSCGLCASESSDAGGAVTVMPAHRA